MLISKIDAFFTNHDKSRITQGDILVDFKVPVSIKTDVGYSVETLTYPFLIVVSQDCDLEQCEKIVEDKYKNTFLVNVLVLPAMPSEKFKNGEGYEDFDISQKPKSGKEMEKIEEGKEDRYLWISGNEGLKLPNLVIDFKHYLTIPYETLNADYKSKYITTINELFRESLSRKFANYLSRIGLPELRVVKPN